MLFNTHEYLKLADESEEAYYNRISNGKKWNKKKQLENYVNVATALVNSKSLLNNGYIFCEDYTDYLTSRKYLKVIPGKGEKVPSTTEALAKGMKYKVSFFINPTTIKSLNDKPTKAIINIATNEATTNNRSCRVSGAEMELLGLPISIAESWTIYKKDENLEKYLNKDKIEYLKGLYFSYDPFTFYHALIHYESNKELLYKKEHADIKTFADLMQYELKDMEDIIAQCQKAIELETSIVNEYCNRYNMNEEKINGVKLYHDLLDYLLTGDIDLDESNYDIYLRTASNKSLEEAIAKRKAEFDSYGEDITSVNFLYYHFAQLKVDKKYYSIYLNKANYRKAVLNLEARKTLKNCEEINQAEIITNILLEDRKIEEDHPSETTIAKLYNKGLNDIAFYLLPSLQALNDAEITTNYKGLQTEYNQLAIKKNKTFEDKDRMAEIEEELSKEEYKNILAIDLTKYTTLNGYRKTHKTISLIKDNSNENGELLKPTIYYRNTSKATLHDLGDRVTLISEDSQDKLTMAKDICLDFEARKEKISNLINYLYAKATETRNGTIILTNDEIASIYKMGMEKARENLNRDLETIRSIQYDICLDNHGNKETFKGSGLITNTLTNKEHGGIRITLDADLLKLLQAKRGIAYEDKRIFTSKEIGVNELSLYSHIVEQENIRANQKNKGIYLIRSLYQKSVDTSTRNIENNTNALLTLADNDFIYLNFDNESLALDYEKNKALLDTTAVITPTYKGKEEHQSRIKAHSKKKGN